MEELDIAGGEAHAVNLTHYTQPCIVLHYTHYITIHYTHYITLITLNTLHYNTPYITLHSLHYIMLHSLHYIMLHSLHSDDQSPTASPLELHP